MHAEARASKRQVVPAATSKKFLDANASTFLHPRPPLSIFARRSPLQTPLWHFTQHVFVIKTLYRCRH